MQWSSFSSRHRALAPAPLATRDGFLADLGSALHTTETALVPKTRRSRRNHFQRWIEFCAEHGRPPSLSDVPLPETRLCYLLVFAVRYRRRTNPRTGELVRADTVETALIAVGQGITALGQPDPRKQAGGDRNDPLLASFIKAMRDQDSPSTRAYTGRQHLHRRTSNTSTTSLTPISQPPVKPTSTPLISASLASSGYSDPPNTSTPVAKVALKPSASVTFHSPLLAASMPPDSSLNDLNIDTVSKATLTFNGQKNAVRGEQISHTATNDAQLCPCKAGQS